MKLKDFIQTGRSQEAAIEKYMKYIRIIIGVVVCVIGGYALYQADILELKYIVIIGLVAVGSLFLELIHWKAILKGDTTETRRPLQNDYDEIDKMLAQERARKRLKKWWEVFDYVKSYCGLW